MNFLQHFPKEWHFEITIWFERAAREAETPDELTCRLTRNLVAGVLAGRTPGTDGLRLPEVLRWLHQDCEAAELMAYQVLEGAGSRRAA